MPGPSVTFPMQLPPQVRRELESLLAQLLEGYLYIEHKDDGTHANITADTVTSVALYLRSPVAGSEKVVKLYATGDASAALQQGDDGDLASLEVTNLTAEVLFLTEFLQLTSNEPEIRWYEADASVNNRYWRAIADGETWKLQAMDDGAAVTATGLEITRSGGVRIAAMHASGIIQADSMLADSGYVVRSSDTSGILLRVNSGVLEVREGDDSGYEALNVRYLFATENVFVADGVSNTPSLCFATDQDTGFHLPAANSVGVSVGGLQGFVFSPTGSGNGFMLTVNAAAFGTGAITGSRLLIGRNTSGSGAPGSISLQRSGGTIDTLWVENSTGDLRIGSGIPREDGSVLESSGTVVGTQTSTRAEKIILGERFDYETSLRHVLDAPVFDFKYRNGRFNGETFTGTTTDDAPIFGMDNGKSLNTISAIGHLMQAVKAQQKQIDALQRQVAELQGRG